MANVQNNLIVIPGGLIKSHSIKVSATQHRRVQQFCKESGWTVEQAFRQMLNNFMTDEAPVWIEVAGCKRLHA